jgi:membrane-associated protease RseP (regulator of RpoE activity)
MCNFHEGGHYTIARGGNVLYMKFSFGMGPSSLEEAKGETLGRSEAFP